MIGYEALSIGGALLYVLAYLLLQTDRISGTGLLFVSLNLAAALLLTAALVLNDAPALVPVYLVWIAVSLYRLRRLVPATLSGRRLLRADPPRPYLPKVRPAARRATDRAPPRAAPVPAGTPSAPAAPVEPVASSTPAGSPSPVRTAPAAPRKAPARSGRGPLGLLATSRAGQLDDYLQRAQPDPRRQAR